MDASWQVWVALVVASALVGLAKGGLSMIGMLSVPILAQVMSPVQAAGVLLPVYVISDIFGLIAYRRRWDRGIVARLLPGTIVGVALGWATASMVNDRWVAGIVGVIGASFAIIQLVRRVPDVTSPRRPDAARGTLWGLTAGYTSFVSHSGAPPFQIYVQPLGLDRQVYAATVTVYFAAVNAIKLIPYAALGQLNMHNLGMAAAMIPVAGIAVLAGVWLVRRIPQRVFYVFITWALLAVSMKLIWDALAG